MTAIRPSKKSSVPMMIISQPANPIHPVQLLFLAIVPSFLASWSRPRVDSLVSQTLLGITGARHLAHVDVRDLDRVVSVAETVPWRDVGLHVAGGIGRAGAKAVAPDRGRVPIERPVLPVVRALWGLELGRMPVAFAGQADVDLRHRSCTRPCLSAHGACAGSGGCAGSGV